MKKRNANIETLRVMLMFLIILLHLSGRFYDVDALRSMSGDIQASALLSSRMIFLLGVNTFAFISGYFGIKVGGQFKFVKYELLALSWGLIFSVVDIVVDGFHPRILMNLMLPTISGVCWYFSAYMFLLFLSPIINKGIEQLGKFDFQMLIVFILGIEFVGGTIYHYNGTSFMQLFELYLIGQYLKRYPISLFEEKATSIFILTMMVNLSVTFMASYFQIGGNHIVKMLETNRNPLILIGAISLFFMFRNSKEKSLSNIISKVAPYMFSVYISHAMLLHINVVDLKSLEIVSPAFSMIIYSVFMLLICIAVDKLRILMFGNLLDKIEGKLTKILIK